MQLRHYPALPRDVAGLAALCAGQDITEDGKFQWRGEVPVVAFGKHNIGGNWQALTVQHALVG